MGVVSQADALNIVTKARYTSDTATTLDGDEIIKFEDKDFDTHNAYNTGTGVYTVPETGYYQVNTGIRSDDVSMVEGKSFELNLEVDSTVVGIHSIEAQNTGSYRFDHNISDLLYLTKGQEVQVRHTHNDAVNPTLVTSASANYFSIYRIPDLSVYGTYNTFEVKSAASSAFNLSTGGYVSNEFAQMSGNSVTLTPGRWRLSGHVYLADGSGTGIEGVLTYWGSTNGANTTTVPTDLASTTGCTVLNNIHGHGGKRLSGDYEDSVFDSTQVIISLTQEVTVYLVPRCFFSTAGTATVTAYLTAERLT